jgi:ell wall binding domain 2 (CWB2)
MSSVAFSVRRRDLAWGVALIVLLSAVWVARGDFADAGVVPPGDGIAVVYVAVSTNYPDSLGVGPGAGANAAPIIIVPTNPPIPPATSAELIRLDPKNVIIVGGTAVISAAMQDALEALLPNAAVSRIGGANRYETNAAFSATTFPIEGWASIPAAAFHGDSPATDTVFTGAFAYNSTDGSLFAPIQLPHGADILEFRADVYDGDNGASIGVFLFRVDAAGISTTAASASSTVLFNGGYTTVSDTTITSLVDNESYAYYVFVTGAASAALVIFNMKVRYRLGVSTG